MRNLESSPWLEQASLVEIKSALQNNQRLSEFQLNVNVARAKADEAGKPSSIKTGRLDGSFPGRNPSSEVPAAPIVGG